MQWTFLVDRERSCSSNNFTLRRYFCQITEEWKAGNRIQFRQIYPDNYNQYSSSEVKRVVMWQEEYHLMVISWGEQCNFVYCRRLTENGRKKIKIWWNKNKMLILQPAVHQYEIRIWEEDKWLHCIIHKYQWALDFTDFINILIYHTMASPYHITSCRGRRWYWCCSVAYGKGWKIAKRERRDSGEKYNFFNAICYSFPTNSSLDCNISFPYHFVLFCVASYMEVDLEESSWLFVRTRVQSPSR